MTTFFVLALLVGLVQLLRFRGFRSGAVVSGILLNSYGLFAIGVGQSVNFVMHSALGDFAAKSIGWAQSPFQLELAFASLGTGVMAFLLHGREGIIPGQGRGGHRNGDLQLRSGGGHVYQMVAHHDFAANNTGLLLFMDIFIPTAGLALVLWHAMARRHGAKDTTDAIELELETLPKNEVVK